MFRRPFPQFSPPPTYPTVPACSTYLACSVSEMEYSPLFYLTCHVVFVEGITWPDSRAAVN